MDGQTSWSRRIAGSDAVDLGSDLIRIDLRRAIFIGAIAGVFVLMGTWGVGQIGDAKALKLLEAILPTTRFLASSVLGASATILALMLTVLSLANSMSGEIGRAHFARISQIALLCTAMLVAATVLLLLLNVPLEESDKLTALYSAIYYFLISYSALLGGLLITTIIMLYAAVRSIIRIVSPDDETSGDG
jgi:hypothetical protein